jgi:hypothetical protein
MLWWCLGVIIGRTSCIYAFVPSSVGTTTFTMTTSFSKFPSRSTCLFSSSNNHDDRDSSSAANGKNDSGSNSNNWDQEETLLAMHLSPLPGKSLRDSLTRISEYAQSFPFAAVLPVQPLHYLPTEDGGVELKFLRKKTDIKSGVDGGIRFFIRPRQRRRQGDDNDNSDEDDDNSNYDGTESNGNRSSDEDGGTESSDNRSSSIINSNNSDMGIEIIAKRNSQGQTIPKMFAEKLVIQAFVKGITQGERGAATATADESRKTRFESPTKDMVALESVFHKWM